MESGTNVLANGFVQGMLKIVATLAALVVANKVVNEVNSHLEIVVK